MAWAHDRAEILFVAPCDLPLLCPEDVRAAVEEVREGRGQAVVYACPPKGPHPLLGAYLTGPALAAARAALGGGARAARELLRGVSWSARTLEGRAAVRVAPCNTPEELQALERGRVFDGTVPAMATPFTALILAAGKGTRMRSELPKVLHRLRGQPLLGHVVAAAVGGGASGVVAVVGYKAEQVRAYASGLEAPVTFALQAEQLGTGHAVACALPALASSEGVVVILSGDVPGIRAETLSALAQAVSSEETPIAMLTFEAEDPTGYGRVVRRADGHVSLVREEKDASDEERRIRECNAGVYAVRREWLERLVSSLGSDNASNEFYLTDVVATVAKQARVATRGADEHEVAGVNTLAQLESLERAGVGETLP